MTSSTVERFRGAIVLFVKGKVAIAARKINSHVGELASEMLFLTILFTMLQNAMASSYSVTATDSSIQLVCGVITASGALFLFKTDTNA